MFRRLPDPEADEVVVSIDGKTGHRARRRHASPRRCSRPGSNALPHHAGLGCAARALLHDGRLLRMPGRHRRRGQPPGLPGARARGHAHRDAARRARGRAMSAAGRDQANLRAGGDRRRPGGTCRRCMRGRTRRGHHPARRATCAGRPDLSCHHGDAGFASSRCWAPITGAAPIWWRLSATAARSTRPAQRCGACRASARSASRSTARRACSGRGT